MQGVLGFGGFFFKARDPDALGGWYAEHLGVAATPTVYGGDCWVQQRGPTVFQPFAEDTTMFGDKHWMLNFRVADLDAMVEQLRSTGTPVDVDGETYPNGRFASLADPEGNPVQLWQPRTTAERLTNGG